MAMMRARSRARGDDFGPGETPADTSGRSRESEGRVQKSQASATYAAMRS